MSHLNYFKLLFNVLNEFGSANKRCPINSKMKLILTLQNFVDFHAEFVFDSLCNILHIMQLTTTKSPTIVCAVGNDQNVKSKELSQCFVKMPTNPARSRLVY